MSQTLVIITSVVATVYLTLWPLRIVMWRKKGFYANKSALFLPALGGLFIIAFDLIAIRQVRPDLTIYFLFIHGFLVFFGLVFALKYLQNVKNCRRSEGDEDAC
ncbi:hypothetical protein KAH81_06660 [bacterium]|nr:hypothetical protein [bacterium]